MRGKPASTLLPKAIRDALIEASRCPQGRDRICAACTLAAAPCATARTRSLDAATSKAKLYHPSFFKEEDAPADD